MRLSAIPFVVAFITLPTVAWSQAVSPGAGNAAANQYGQGNGNLTLARKCGWSSPLALSASEGVLEIMGAELVAKAPAETKARLEAAVTQVRAQASAMDCAAAQGRRAAAQTMISGHLEQMLIQTDYFAAAASRPIIGLSQADGEEVSLSVAWVEALQEESRFSAYTRPFYARARNIAAILCAVRKAEGRPLDIIERKLVNSTDMTLLPAAKIAARRYKAFGEAIAAVQRGTRTALVRRVGNLTAYYKAGARPSDCRAGDIVYDYGSAPKRTLDLNLRPNELSLVRRQNLGAPPSAPPTLHHRTEVFGPTLLPNPEMVELTPIPSDGAVGDRLAGWAVSGVAQFTPEETARLKGPGVTDVMVAQHARSAADSTFNNIVVKAGQSFLGGTGARPVRWWRCPTSK